MAKINSAFPHDSYTFVHKPIRDADSENRYFLERFFLGFQSQFETTYSNINDLVNLFNPSKAPDEVLQYLKDHVGFTKELEDITQGLTNNELRKLIILAVPLWRQKGFDVGYKNIVRLFTGANSRTFNWFDFRLIIGEKALGEEQLGEDSWLISRVGLEGSTPINDVISLLTFENGINDGSIYRNHPMLIGSAYESFFYDDGAVTGSSKYIRLEGSRIKIPKNSKQDFSGDLTIEGFFRTDTDQSNVVLFRTENDTNTRLIEISLNTSTNELSYSIKTEDIVMNDDSDYNNDGEYENGLIPVLGGDPSIVDSTRSLLGNGVDQYGKISYRSEYNLSNNWTLEFRIKRNGAPLSTQRIFGKETSGDLRGSYRIDETPTGLVFTIQDFISGIDESVTIPSASVFDNNWHAISYTKSGTELHHHLDGIRLAVTPLSNTNSLDAQADVYVLTDIDFNSFSDVQLDELRISLIDRYAVNSYLPATSEFIADIYTSLLLHFDESDTISDTISSAENLKDEQWRHFALVLNKETAKARMWLDGTESTVELENGLRDVTTNSDIFIGAENIAGSNNYVGDLDNIRVSLNAIYDTSLSTYIKPVQTFIEYVEEQLDEFQTDIRVVDDGELNKSLLLKVINLMRPSSERLNIIYIRYFEDFSVGKGTLSSLQPGAYIFEGNLIMPSGSLEISDIGEDDLKDIYLQVAVSVGENGEFRLGFNQQTEFDYYRFVLNTVDSTFRLDRVVGGTSSIIAGPTSGDIIANTQYILTVSTSYNPFTSATRIKCFHDSNLIFELDDSVFEDGRFTIASHNTESKVTEIEMFLKPLLTNRIDPNFTVS